MKVDANNAHQTPSASPSPTGKAPRAALCVRIVLAVIAVLALLAAACACVNIAAIDTYNQATQRLELGIAEAKRPDADLNNVLNEAQQTQAQYDEARRFRPILARSLSTRIDENVDVTQHLAAATRRKLAENKRRQTNNANGGGTKQQARNGMNDESARHQGLTEEQRQEVERVLKANQGATSQNDKPNQPRPKAGDTDAKPW